MNRSASRWPSAISVGVLSLAAVLIGCAEPEPVAPPEGSTLEVEIVQDGVYLSRRLSLLMDQVTVVTIGNPVHDRLMVPVAPGQRRIQLVGLESNCLVAGGASRAVTVPKVGATAAEFRVTCSAGNILGGREMAGVVEPPETVGAWNADGSRFAMSTGRSRVLIEPEEGGGALIMIPRPAMEIAGLAWSPEGETLAILARDVLGSQVRTVYLWSARSGVTPLLEWVAPPAAYWGKLDWTPDGSALVVGVLSLAADCQVIAVVPLADPVAWRPLLPCQDPDRIRWAGRRQ